MLLGPAPGAALAAPGDLDPTFGDEGVVLTTAFARTEARAHDVAVLGDGAVLAAGVAGNGATGKDFLLVRLNADGAPDAAFGSGGTVLTDFAGHDDEARALAVQGDGKIVLAGSASDGTYTRPALARYNADGSLDTTFDGDGKVVLDPLFSTNSMDDGARDVIVQPDGKIVLAGAVTNQDGTRDFVVARLEASGALDASFQGGIVKTNFDVGRQGAEALALQGDKIVAAGERSVGDDRLFVVARYNADGTLDASFDGDGKVLLSFPNPSGGPEWTGGAGGLKAVAVQGSNIVVGAPLSRSDGNTFTYNFGLTRLTDGGALDPAFGSGGRVITDFSGEYDLLYDLAVQADGKIVAGGSMEWNRFLVARYLANGTLDTSFGGDGWATTDLEGSDGNEGALALAPGGKIVLAGEADDVGSTVRVALARFDGSGALDTSFGGDGAVALRAGVGLSTGNAHALQVLADGRIVVGGTANRVDSDFVALRYGPGGTLDASFGAGGVAFADFAMMYDVGEAVAVQPDSKVLMAGFAETPGAYDFALARFNADGTPDASFGGDGLVTTDFAGGTDWAYALLLLPGGKFLVAGSAERETSAGFDVDFALARYNPDGSLDTSFGSGGKVMTDFAGQADQAMSLALQPDGKIVLAGSAGTGQTPEGYPSLDFALARYKPDGTLDRRFDGDGKLTTDFGSGDDVAYDVVALPDGAIVAAGKGGAPSAFALARYKPNGALDRHFDGDGMVTTSLGGQSDEARALVALPGGGLIAGGSTYDGVGSAFALARYAPNGALDPAFGSGGKVVTELGDYGTIEDLALQPDGKLLAAGGTSWPWPGVGDYVTLTRYETGLAPLSTPGFAMGAGWAGVPQGKLYFHLRARYRAGQPAPTGGAEFYFERNFYFHGTELEQLEMSGAQATLRGTGLLVRNPGRFEATVTDARLTPEPGDRDALHLRLWDAQGALVYEGGGTLGGGSVVIQVKAGALAASVEEGDGDWVFLPWVGN
jgi:uncharacterized delta-60 repeat protein